MQRGARFVIRKVPFAVPCWVKSGRQKRYKTNAFLLIFKIMGVCLDPVCLGPVRLDAVCLDPICLDPICLDPVCLGPICLDPICLDPVCLEAIFPDPVCLNPFWMLAVGLGAEKGEGGRGAFGFVALRFPKALRAKGSRLVAQGVWGSRRRW